MADSHYTRPSTRPFPRSTRSHSPAPSPFLPPQPARRNLESEEARLKRLLATYPREDAPEPKDYLEGAPDGRDFGVSMAESQDGSFEERERLLARLEERTRRRGGEREAPTERRGGLEEKERLLKRIQGGREERMRSREENVLPETMTRPEPTQRRSLEDKDRERLYQKIARPLPPSLPNRSNSARETYSSRPSASKPTPASPGQASFEERERLLSRLESKISRQPAPPSPRFVQPVSPVMPPKISRRERDENSERLRERREARLKAAAGETLGHTRRRSNVDEFTGTVTGTGTGLGLALGDRSNRASLERRVSTEGRRTVSVDETQTQTQMQTETQTTPKEELGPSPALQPKKPITPWRARQQQLEEKRRRRKAGLTETLTKEVGPPPEESSDDAQQPIESKREVRFQHTESPPRPPMPISPIRHRSSASTPIFNFPSRRTLSPVTYNHYNDENDDDLYAEPEPTLSARITEVDDAEPDTQTILAPQQSQQPPVRPQSPSGTIEIAVPNTPVVVLRNSRRLKEEQKKKKESETDTWDNWAALAQSSSAGTSINGSVDNLGRKETIPRPGERRIFAELDGAPASTSGSLIPVSHLPTPPPDSSTPTPRAQSPAPAELSPDSTFLSTKAQPATPAPPTTFNLPTELPAETNVLADHFEHFAQKLNERLVVVREDIHTARKGVGALEKRLDGLGNVGADCKTCKSTGAAKVKNGRVRIVEVPVEVTLWSLLWGAVVSIYGLLWGRRGTVYRMFWYLIWLFEVCFLVEFWL